MPAVQRIIGVLGAGSWATALVKILTDNGHTVHWYVRNPEHIESIERRGNNPRYVSSIDLPLKLLHMSSDLNEVVSTCNLLVIAIPSAFLHQTFGALTVPYQDKVFFSAVKGIIPETELIVGEHLNQVMGVPMKNIGVITGPCHAEEVALERLSYLTIACLDLKNGRAMAGLLANNYIKTQVSRDVIGTEYAAVFKNIYALAAGIAHGLGYGDNFQAVLMSNAIREMKKIIKSVHKLKRNINQSAYLGDLLVTGYSVFSRNRMFGNMIGKGYTVKSAMAEMSMVAEGYYAAKSAYKLIECKGAHEKAPIACAVYRILYGGESPKKVFKSLVDQLD